MELPVHDISGKKTSKKVKLNDAIYGVEPNDHAIYLDAKQYMANKRQGTAKSKERAEISGSTRKIKKQKGTGTARAGSIKSPLFRGGGTVFGPRPRDYSFKLNKKVKKLARKSALTYKAKEEGILVVENFKMDEAKTKKYLDILNNLKVAEGKTLMVVAELDNNTVLSSRNVKNTKVVVANEINTYDVLNANNVILQEGAVEQIETILK